MADRLESIIRELTATRVKLENLCAKVESIVERLEKDHDFLLRNSGRINQIESWMKTHRDEHEQINTRLNKIVDELEDIIKKIKKIETKLEESGKWWMAKITIGSAIIGALAGALATSLFGMLLH